MINLSEGYAQSSQPARFKPGLVIRHKRYHYRGVIVDMDQSCQAPQDWYLSNQTQPDKKQPWYHVLVDGNQQVTYVAESNLQHDQTGQPIVNPMLNLFFSGYDEENNIYKRNHVPWDPGKPPNAPPSTPPPNFTPPPPTNI